MGRALVRARAGGRKAAQSTLLTSLICLAFIASCASSSGQGDATRARTADTSAAVPPASPGHNVQLCCLPSPNEGLTAALCAVSEARPPSATTSTTHPAMASGPRHLRRLLTAELTPALLVAARDLIPRYANQRLGTEIPLLLAGREYVAIIEQHFHPEGGTDKPYGYHRGVSLFLDLDAEHSGVGQ